MSDPIRVIPTFGGRDVGTIKENKFTAAPKATTAPVRKQKPLDLGGKPAVLLALGGGGTGKTTWIRYVVDRAAGGVALAALDRSDRLLSRFFDGVAMPAQDATEVEGAAWLAEFLEFVVNNKVPAVIDFGGGGDSYLRFALAADPGLLDAITGAGMAVVPVLFLSPREQDIQLLVDMDATGIKPSATIIALNEAQGELGTPFEAAFAGVLGHSAYLSAISRGAYVVRIPRLFPQALAHEIERKRFLFRNARDGISPDPETTPIRGFDRSRVRRWLDDMEAAHEVVLGALP